MMRTNNTMNIFFYFCLAMANLWVMVGFITNKDTQVMFLLWIIAALIVMIFDAIDRYQYLQYLKKRLRYLQHLNKRLDKDLDKLQGRKIK